MNDIADQADRACEHDLKLAMAAHDAAMKDVNQHRLGDVVFCADCGDVVDADRVAAKPDCVRCIGCQAAKEREDKLWR